MLAPGGVRDAANPHPNSVRACVSSPFPTYCKPPALAYFGGSSLGGAATTIQWPRSGAACHSADDRPVGRQRERHANGDSPRFHVRLVGLGRVMQPGGCFNASTGARWGMAAQMRQGYGVTWLAVVHRMVDGGSTRRRITLARPPSPRRTGAARR